MTKSISEKKPWRSNSIGCPRAQVKEHNEALRKLGIKNAYIDSNGQAVAHSQKGRNELMKAYGKLDRDAGYGQHSGS